MMRMKYNICLGFGVSSYIAPGSNFFISDENAEKNLEKCYFWYG